MNTIESGIKNAKDTVFGKGSISQLELLLEGFRDDEKPYAIYFVSKFFEKSLEPHRGLLNLDKEWA